MTYAKPDGIVSTNWLARHLNDPKVKIIDVTYFHHSLKRDAKAEHDAKHIPGAVHFNIDDIKMAGDPRPHMLPSPEVFAEKVGALGISNGNKVICYDMTGLQTAARGWWMFRVFGHDDVAVLDGGLPKWISEGQPVTSEPSEVRPATFKASFRPALVRSLDDLRANLESRKEQVVDARASGRFQGSRRSCGRAVRAISRSPATFPSPTCSTPRTRPSFRPTRSRRSSMARGSTSASRSWRAAAPA